MAAASFSASYQPCLGIFWRRHSGICILHFCILGLLRFYGSHNPAFSQQLGFFVCSSISFPGGQYLLPFLDFYCFSGGLLLNLMWHPLLPCIFPHLLDLAAPRDHCYARAMASSAATFASLALLAASADATSHRIDPHFAFATRSLTNCFCRSIPRSISLISFNARMFWMLKEKETCDLSSFHNSGFGILL